MWKNVKGLIRTIYRYLKNHNNILIDAINTFALIIFYKNKLF